MPTPSHPSAVEPNNATPADRRPGIPGRPAWFRRSRANEPRPFLWLAEWDTLVCLGLGTLFLAMLTIGRLGGPGYCTPGMLHAGMSHERPDRRLPPYRLDLNRATWAEFAQLEGIGPALARRIVVDREQRGPFRTVDHLARVRGIGPKTLAALRPFVRVELAISEASRREGRNGRIPPVIAKPRQ